MSDRKIQLDNEMSLIGSVVLNGDCMVNIVDIVEPKDFTTIAYAEIYSCAVEMYLEGKTIDPITLIDKLKSKNIFVDDINSLMQDLMLMTPTAANAVEYAKSVAETSRMRRINNLVIESMREHRTSEKLIEKIMTGLHSIENGNVRGKSVLLGHIMHDLAAWVNDKSAEDERIKTGYLDLDKTMGGMSPGNLVVVAGRPGTGKSAFTANIAKNAAERGIVTIFFSCEMEKEELGQRFVANKAKISLTSIMNKSFTNDESDKKRASEAATELAQLPLSIYDEAGISVNDIRREIQTTKNVGLVVIDYLQIMRVVGKYENRNLEIAGITATLKLLAKEFKIPIIILSQLKRIDEYVEPQLGHLRDSGSIEQDADKVIMLWRAEEAKNNELPKIGVKIAKDRQGETAAFVMLFRGEYMEFLESIEPYVSKRGKRRRYADSDMPF